MPNVSQRLGAIGLIVSLLFFALFGRLGQLQIVENEKANEESIRNLVRIGFEPSVRGRILDRNGNVLVGNRKVNVVKIDTSKLPKNKARKRAVLFRLGQVLGISYETMTARVNRRGGQLEAVEVAREVRETTVVFLNEQAEEFPGVVTTVETQRVYPQGKLAAHVVGFTGDIGDEIKEPRCSTAYQEGDKVGKAGVEREYECVLRGLPGKYEYTVNRANEVVGKPRELVPPVPGRDIRLTIDPEIQAIAESTLQGTLRLARSEVGEDNSVRINKKAQLRPLRAPAGAIVVLDATDGSVVAMASYPTYDPNDFVRGIDSAEYSRKYGDKDLAPLTNRAITTRYSPASTFKTFTAIAGLRSEMISAGTTFMDNGTWTLPDCTKNPSLKTKIKCTFRNAGSTPHGPVDMTLSLIVSSDVYYYDLSWKIFRSPEPKKFAIQEVAREFGMGDRTNVALPYEKSFPVPSPEAKKLLNEANKKVWPDPVFRTGDNINLSIGQGELAITPLNLASAYGAFANGGTLYVPKIAFDTPPPPDGAAIEAAINAAAATSTVPEAAVSADSEPVGVTRSGSSPAGPSSSEPAGAAATSATPPTNRVEPATTLPQATTSTTVVPPAELTPTIRRNIDLPDSIRQPIVEGLKGVTSSKFGTAADAFAGFPFDEFFVAGKTGTAQTSKQDNAIFIGFGPVQNPKYVVAVVLEQAGFGGQNAAPAARRVFNVLAGREAGPITLVRSRGAIDR
jgi:penicillin-binding protein 2